MARLALKIKAARKAKFSTRAYNRCPICGRPRAYLRQFGLCRICFRNTWTIFRVSAWTA